MSEWLAHPITRLDGMMLIVGYGVLHVGVRVLWFIAKVSKMTPQPPPPPP